MQPDGHCLFAAIHCARLSESEPLPANLPDVGPMARRRWVELAHRLLWEGVAEKGASVPEARAILLDGTLTVAQYLELMSKNSQNRESWGGESELHMMAILWKCRMCTLLFRQDPVEDSQVRLLACPLGTTGHIHALLFNGNHYDLVILTQKQLILLGLPP